MIRYEMMLPEHIAQVAEMEKEIFSLPWSQKAFMQSLSNPNTIYVIAKDDERVIGYCGLYFSFEVGNITNMAVKPEYRGRGIATGLLKELIRYAGARGVDAFTLEVRRTNIVAIELYEHLGFQTQGIRKNFYEKPTEDALIMWKKR